MPICVKCKEEKTVSSFPPSGGSYCSSCVTQNSREWAKNHPNYSRDLLRKKKLSWTEDDWERERARKRQVKKDHPESEKIRVHRRLQRLRDHIDEYKAELGCQDPSCPGYEFEDLEFHHLDPSQKEMTISKVRSWAQFEREVKKCIVLCWRCHMKAHGKEPKVRPAKKGRPRKQETSHP